MTTWLGPVPPACQLCGGAFRGTMYDANLRGVGWGNFCHPCFGEHSGRLGTGLGQRYELKAGKWEKTSG